MAKAIAAARASAPPPYSEAPSVVDIPVIMLGDAIVTSCNVGDTLTVTMGNWVGEPAFDKAWTSNGDKVGTGIDYTTQESDIDATIECTVTGVNNAGSTEVTASNAVTVAAAT
jgi:hypothetical protein